MRRTLAKLRIYFASDTRNLPAWVTRVAESDDSVRSHFLAMQALEKRLKTDRDAWLDAVKATPKLSISKHPNRSAGKYSVLRRMHLAWRLPIASASRSMVPLGACLVLLLASWWLWGERQTAVQNWESAVRGSGSSSEDLLPSPPPSTVDWRPLLAAASAGQQVARRITECTGEWIVNTTDVAGQAMRRPIGDGPALPDDVWSESKAGVQAALRPLTMMLNLNNAPARSE